MENSDVTLVQERAERLKEALRLAGGGAAVAKQIGMPIPTLNNYIAGRDMKASALIALAEACGVSLDWLATGRGRKTVTASSLPEWLGEFAQYLDKPAQFFRFCLLMQACQHYHLALKVRPTLREALSWVAKVYCDSKVDDRHDSLVAEAFMNSNAIKYNPWDHINDEDTNKPITNNKGL